MSANLRAGSPHPKSYLFPAWIQPTMKINVRLFVTSKIQLEKYSLGGHPDRSHKYYEKIRSHCRWCPLRELVVQASAKNVNRLRALRRQLCRQAIIYYAHTTAHCADNFADKQPAYYAHTTLLWLLCRGACKAK